MRKAFLLRILLLATITSMGIFVMTTFTKVYAEDAPLLTDLNGTEEYYSDIIALYNHHIISGYPDGTFRPTEKVNRAEALKMIMLGAEIIDPENPTPNANTKLTFTDIDTTGWYVSYVALGVEKNIVSGYSDNTFHPEAPVNMAETLKMLVNTFKITIQDAPTEDPFQDVPKDEWYATYAKTLEKSFILYGDNNGTISPGHNVTRGEFAHWLYRTMTRDTIATKIENGRASYYADLFEGDHTANGDVFTQENYTAAHRTLPFGTVIRVINTATKKSTEVTINDRGPYDDRFILDLSESAFQEIGSLSSGIIPIQIEIISE